MSKIQEELIAAGYRLGEGGVKLCSFHPALYDKFIAQGATLLPQDAGKPWNIRIKHPQLDRGMDIGDVAAVLRLREYWQKKKAP